MEPYLIINFFQMPSIDLLTRARAALQMPPDVVAFKVMQRLKLEQLRRAQGWQKLEGRIRDWWTTERICDWAAADHSACLIADDGVEARMECAALGLIPGHPSDPSSVKSIRVLNEVLDIDEKLPWHEDWRFNHSWDPRYFRTYDFYKPVNRVQPYDIKYPWELSRLRFLPLILEREILTNTTGHALELLGRVLVDWEESNPLAHSANWQPMEASMRSINLCAVSGMLRSLDSDQTELSAALLRLLSAHGEFIWRTREFSDIRGNHYAANIAALILIGAELGPAYPASESWLRFGSQKLDAEIPVQFLPDGVHFEKSVAYHRLVTELFLIALITLQKVDKELSQASTTLLQRAVQYCADLTRPDDSLINVGDSDGAVGLPFVQDDEDASSLLGLASVVWSTQYQRRPAVPPVVPLVLGKKGVERWRELPEPKWRAVRRHYQDGGVVVVNEQSTYLWMDFGEVGLKGRGGHGHNDILSFEIWMSGRPLILDPGTYMYTGDQTARDLFRGSAYHNGLVVDGQEVAPLRSMWRIGGEATPTDVTVELEDAIRLEGGHTGYLRLDDPVMHRRKVVLNPEAQSFECHDFVESKESHLTERYLHLSPQCSVTARDGDLLITCEGLSWKLTHDYQSSSTCELGWISTGYGSRVAGRIVKLTRHVTGSTHLFLTLNQLRVSGTPVENSIVESMSS
jgi:uncharacterized heparinase superfamily protein